MTPRPKLNPWDRRDDEGDAAWRAFQLYRDAGAERSHSFVASELISSGHRRGKVGVVRNDLATWSTKYKWVERCISYDRYLDKMDQLAMQRERRDMRRRQARMAQAFQAALSVPAQAMARKFETDRRLVEDLAREDVAHLVELMSKAGRVLPGIVNIERVAMGEDVVADESWTAGEVFEDRVSEEQRLVRVARIMQEHNLLLPAPGDEAIEA